MTTPTDFRALLADDVYAASFQSLGQYRAALLKALATPPPKQPTDKELWETGDDSFQANYYPTDAIKFARAVLKRWGNQATITQLHND